MLDEEISHRGYREHILVRQLGDDRRQDIDFLDDGLVLVKDYDLFAMNGASAAINPYPTISEIMFLHTKAQLISKDF
jgi:hypothetical protein